MWVIPAYDISPVNKRQRRARGKMFAIIVALVRWKFQWSNAWDISTLLYVCKMFTTGVVHGMVDSCWFRTSALSDLCLGWLIGSGWSLTSASPPHSTTSTHCPIATDMLDGPRTHKIRETTKLWSLRNLWFILTDTHASDLMTCQLRAIICWHLIAQSTFGLSKKAIV